MLTAAQRSEVDRSPDGRDARIAADLHEHVVRELYSVGLGLHGVASGVADARLQGRLLGYVDSLDALVAQIRTTIVELGDGPRDLPRHTDLPHDLARRVLDVLDEDCCGLGFPASVAFSGSLNGELTNELTDDLVAVLRESVSNVVQHADASAVQIAIGAAEGWLVLDVIDDGHGIDTARSNGGLAAMHRRARSHDGSLVLSHTADGGTHLRWSAHLPGE